MPGQALAILAIVMTTAVMLANIWSPTRHRRHRPVEAVKKQVESSTIPQSLRRRAA